MKQYNIFGNIDEVEYIKETDEFKIKDMKLPSYWIIPATTTIEKDLTKRVNNLTKRVCESYYISEKELMSNRRLRYIVLPRQVVMYILRKEYNMTFERIAKLFNKTHATVISSVNVIENMMTYDEELRNKVNYLL